MKYPERSSRAGLILLQLSWLLAACAAFGLVRRKDRSNYFPMQEGDFWQYRLITTVAHNGKLDTTTRADYRHWIAGKARLPDGNEALVRVWESEVTLHDTVLAESTFTQAETSYYRATRNAVLRYLSLTAQPDTILLLPLAIDRRWKSNGVNYWVIAREDITIAGQNYPGCWRIKTSTPEDPIPTNTWFAQGVGLVRLLAERTFGDRRMTTDYYLVRAAVK